MTINSGLIIGLVILVFLFYIASNIFKYLEKEQEKEELKTKVEHIRKIQDEYSSDTITVEEALEKWDKGEI